MFCTADSFLLWWGRCTESIPIRTIHKVNMRTMKLDHPLRVGYSFFGLLAGDAVLLILTVVNALHISLLLHGQLKAQFLIALGSFIPVAIVSVVGWLIVGVPAVLSLSPRRVLQAPLWLLLSLGVVLGPAALFVIFLLLSWGMPKAETFTNTGFLWACSSLISTVAFAVHCALMRRHARWMLSCDFRS